MTENKRFQIIHLGNPYDFVVKDHQTNKTYGTLQGDDKSLMELLNELAEENKELKYDNFNLNKTVECLDKTVKEQCNKIDWADECGVRWEEEYNKWIGGKND